MTPLKTQREIRDGLVALITTHTGVLAGSIEADANIWEHFPEYWGRGTSPVVTSFINDVQSAFNVFLTEEEWEDPTPDSLARLFKQYLQSEL